MAQQVIDIGTTANDGTGDPLRNAFDKVNDNFNEVYPLINFASLTSDTDNLENNSEDNAIESGCSTCVIGGGGTDSFPNLIGSTGKPVGTDFTPTGWANDIAYVSGTADVALIAGGYDHINNQLAGTIVGGGHNFIKYHSGGHSTIVGGSYNIIAGARGFIGGGRRNVVASTSDYGTIVGGDDNEVASSYAFIGGGNAGDIAASAANASIVGGNQNTISSGCTGAFIGGGGQNDVETTALYGTIIGGLSNTLQNGANYSVVSGLTNTVSGSYSLVIGREHSINNAYVCATGEDVLSIADYSRWHGAGAINETGDKQAGSIVVGRATTSATLTTVSVADLADSKATAGFARVRVVAMRDGSPDANNDADYSSAAYSLDVAFAWDGTNFVLGDSGGSTTSGERTMTEIYDGITIGAPTVALSTGLLRVKVTGLASTTINWVIEVDFPMTTSTLAS